MPGPVEVHDRGLDNASVRIGIDAQRRPVAGEPECGVATSRPQEQQSLESSIVLFAVSRLLCQTGPS